MIFFGLGKCLDLNQLNFFAAFATHFLKYGSYSIIYLGGAISRNKTFSLGMVHYLFLFFLLFLSLRHNIWPPLQKTKVASNPEYKKKKVLKSMIYGKKSMNYSLS